MKRVNDIWCEFLDWICIILLFATITLCKVLELLKFDELSQRLSRKLVGK